MFGHLSTDDIELSLTSIDAVSLIQTIQYNRLDTLGDLAYKELIYRGFCLTPQHRIGDADKSTPSPARTIDFDSDAIDSIYFSE
jgi:hypothetical protein